MSGPTDNHGWRDGRRHPNAVGQREFSAAPGEASGDFGLDRAIEQLEAELSIEPVAGPSAVDVMGSARIVVREPVPGATGRVVGAPPLGGEGPSGDKPAPDDASPPGSAAATRRDLGMGARRPVSARPLPSSADAGRGALALGDTPSSALPSARPGVQGPAFDDSDLRPKASAEVSAAPAWRPPKASQSAAWSPPPSSDSAAIPQSQTRAWQPPGASESAIAAFGRVAAVASDAVPPQAEPATPAAVSSPQPWDAARTVVGRSPSPRHPPPRPLWLVFLVITGIVAGAVAVVVLARAF